MIMLGEGEEGIPGHPPSVWNSEVDQDAWNEDYFALVTYILPQ